MISRQVIIVGGGPAGAACAARLEAGGLEPLILDQASFPRNKICAGWVTPEVFQSLGVKPGEYPHSLTVFPSLRLNIKRLPLIRPGTQYAIRRIEFDSWLLERSGAEIHQHQVRDIRRTRAGFELDGKYQARYLVGAGGTYCPVYRSLFRKTAPRQGTAIIALEEEFQGDWSDPTCRLWFMEGGLPGYSWYVPKKGGYLNIGLGANAAALKEGGSSLQEYWQRLIDKLEELELVPERSWNPQGYQYYLRAEHQTLSDRGAFLIGDAAGLSTLDMGEGIGPAIRSGQQAAMAILNDAPYQLDGISRFSLLPRGLRWLLRKGAPPGRGS